MRAGETFNLAFPLQECVAGRPSNDGRSRHHERMIAKGFNVEHDSSYLDRTPSLVIRCYQHGITRQEDPLNMDRGINDAKGKKIIKAEREIDTMTRYWYVIDSSLKKS